jgi:sigma-54 dependent transcriptional regulator, acetoin dehydrogenase operon transcriptional activator AcoR
MPSVSKCSDPIRAHERLALPDLGRTFDAWHRLVEAGEVRGAGLRAHVRRAWRRSRRSGCRPHAMAVPRLTDQETRGLLDRERALIEAARPYVAALSRAAGAQCHAALLCDRHGRVLDVVGDEAGVHGPGRVPGLGSLLSEAEAGANGIGTTLAEGGSVELVGPEHFLADFHPFTSQGTLLRVEGQVVGVLGIWVRRLERTERVHDILVCAARGIEAELLGRSLADAVQRLAPGAGDDRPLEALRQDMVQLQAAARLRLEVAAQSLGEGGDTVDLLVTAERLIRTFHERAALWRDLVDEESGVARAVLLHEHLGRFVALLGTEAECRGITVERGLMVPVIAHVDPRALSRALLRLFLHAFEMAAEGGRVHVMLVQDERRLSGVIHLAASEHTAHREHRLSLEAPVTEVSR